MEEPGTPVPLIALAANSSKDKKTSTKQSTRSSQTPPSTRRTRSQAAPDWTVQETLILVGEIAALAEGWLKALSSYQKWKMISDNCMAFQVSRSSNECKRRWELLLADYQKITDWDKDSQSRVGSYWSLDGERRKQYNLPVSFDEEVFSSLDAVINSQENEPVSVDSEPEDLIPNAEVEMLEIDDVHSDPETMKDTIGVRDMANKLQERAELVHAILRGELKDDINGNRALVDPTKPTNSTETEFARRQAGELIKAVGNMVGALNQFSELIKDGRCK